MQRDMTIIAKALARAAMLCEWATDGLVPSEDQQPFRTIRQECEAALALMGYSASEFADSRNDGHRTIPQPSQNKLG